MTSGNGHPWWKKRRQRQVTDLCRTGVHVLHSDGSCPKCGPKDEGRYPCERCGWRHDGLPEGWDRYEVKDICPSCWVAREFDLDLSSSSMWVEAPPDVR